MSWFILPTELQLIVLEHLAQLEFQNRIEHKPNAPYSTGTSLSKYVAVSEQWQEFFEPRIMDTLHIGRHDIKMFAHVFRVERRREYLRQIALVIRLPDGVPPFRMMEDSKESFIVDLVLQADLVDFANMYGLPPSSGEVRNNIALMETVYALLVQLSRWKAKHVRRGGIGLELLADSQSSWQVIASQLTAFQRPIDFNGRSISSVEQQWTIDAAMDNFFLSLDFETEHYQGPALEMPKVGVITSLSIMRRSTRRFGCSMLAELMGDLPALKHLVWEIEPMRSQSLESWFQDYLTEVARGGPRRMDSIQIVHLQPHIKYLRLNPDAPLIPSLSSNLADRAQYLQHLCISYPIDAFQFFKKAVRGKYPTLRSLTVWSKQRIVERAPSTSHDLLRLVSRALFRMSNMQFLAVYNMGPSSAGLFTYDASGKFSGHGSLYRLCSSWHWELSREMRKFLWDSVLQRESRGFTLRGEKLPTEEVKSLISTILEKSEATGRDDKGVGM
ncbi:uncharacterized protein FTOL_02937 [Fusarium torulosum]|uniref:DUF6546 domain-containing protein n=1 Tax=Fusarium torulosum TaxID=33205 RepID=A0AAE8M2Z1_9HYPO|nr:uncharacterized protein FTOL_02937 [Fusarium torulosum]